VCACVRAHFAFLAWAAAGVKDRPGEVKNRLLGPSAACPVPVAGNTTAQKLEPPTPSNPKKPISQKNPKTLPFFFSFRSRVFWLIVSRQKCQTGRGVRYFCGRRRLEGGSY
jgi:hypothetical protein